MKFPARSALFLLSLALLGMPAAPALAGTTTALGLDSGLNLLVLGDLRVSGSDVEGQVAVAGNASLANYSINAVGGTGTGLTVGGNLAFSSGSIQGDSRVGGNVTASYSGSYFGSLFLEGLLDASAGLWLSSGNSVTTWGGATGLKPWYPAVEDGSGSFDLGFDFAGAKSAMGNLSSSLGAMAATGQVTNRWGTLVLDASGLSGTVVFNLTADQAAMNMEIDGLAADATVVINVAGSSVNFGNHGYTNFASAGNRILFNLPDATSLTFNGGTWASFLAPSATVNQGWGQINGQVVVDNWYSSVQVNVSPFAGVLPVMAAGDSTQETPEPASLALALAGGLMLVQARKRSPSVD